MDIVASGYGDSALMAVASEWSLKMAGHLCGSRSVKGIVVVVYNVREAPSSVAWTPNVRVTVT